MSQEAPPLKANTSLLRMVKNGFEIHLHTGSFIRHATYDKKIKAVHHSDVPLRGAYFPLTVDGLQAALDYAFPEFKLYK